MNFRTLSGIEIDPLNPRPENFKIQDIARALDKLCRFSGQFPYHYSVAAHSLAVSNYIERNGGTPLEALAGLLHDASEAYLADLPTPFKMHCNDYHNLEVKYQSMIFDVFGVGEIEFCDNIVPIWDADQAVLIPEKLAQLDSNIKLDYAGRSCYKEFMRRYIELGGPRFVRKATQARLDMEAQKLNDMLEAEDIRADVESYDQFYGVRPTNFLTQTEQNVIIKKHKPRRKNVKRLKSRKN